MEELVPPLEDNLTKLSELKAQYDDLAEQLRPIEAEINGLKLVILAQMHDQKSKRTEAINGVYAIRAERKNVVITDEKAVTQFLTDNGFALDEYLRLDAARIKALADSTLKETGELVPGLQTSTTEYLTIKTEVA